MFMTFEKIEPPAPAEPVETIEHPAARAARMIRDLHLQNITMMDQGHVFLKDGVDVNEEVRAACHEQIAHCDRIIERAAHMDPKLWQPAQLILEDLQATLDGSPKTDDELLPEVGNYDHDEKA